MKTAASVIPAKAGTQEHGLFRIDQCSWVPAFAGMTAFISMRVVELSYRNPGRGSWAPGRSNRLLPRALPVAPVRASAWIERPAGADARAAAPVPRIWPRAGGAARVPASAPLPPSAPVRVLPAPACVPARFGCLIGGAFLERRRRAVVDRLDLVAGQFLDRGDLVALGGGGEGDRGAGGAGAAGAADAVDVIVRLPRHVIVEHVADALDVQPARGDVGGDQDVDVAGLEPLQLLQALGLLHVAVDRGRP